MYNMLRVVTPILQCYKTAIISKRSTYILRRRFVPLLNKLGSKDKRKLRRKDYYYDLVEDTSEREQPEVDLVLLKSVEGIGTPGDIIKVKKLDAYEYYILSGAAVYATPDNVEKYGSPREEIKIPSDVLKVIMVLKQKTIPIFMSAVNPWTIEPWHVKAALRKSDINCNEDDIELPKSAISGPDINLEGKDFVTKLKVYESEVLPLRCRLFHMYTFEDNFQSQYDSNYHMKRSEPIFPEEKDLLESIELPVLTKEDDFPKILS